METNYTFSNISNIDITFFIKQKSRNLDNKDNELQNDSMQNKGIKKKFPKNKIFRINSFNFNAENNCNELYTQYDCIYDEKNNSLYLIISGKTNYDKLAKDRLINILEFSIFVEIDIIYLLVGKANEKYINIIQDMIIVGFEYEDNLPVITIDGNVYKKLKMSIKDISKEIEEINLI